jgi:hypothetical protein
MSDADQVPDRRRSRNATAIAAPRLKRNTKLRGVAAKLHNRFAPLRPYFVIRRRIENTMKNESSAVSKGADKVSNGRLLSKAVDMRSAGGRRFRHLVQSYVAELGGVEHLAESDFSLIKQAVALQMQAEAMQESIVRGEAVDPDALIRVSSTSKRMLEAITTRVEANKPPPLTPLQVWQAERAAKVEAGTDEDSE